ncbi:hypothetical protein AVEN_252513-1 [Araneus ventricosus]|uniref:HSF-type DNA-binding domain-containing protein n=1 Tax=Araneus ventricosus TaxID=182803 RepID=A0A4Y2ATP6_ARAVE|nr:hypothetical protein AVEN_252513-1 [Araneus ventricosus]
MNINQPQKPSYNVTFAVFVAITFCSSLCLKISLFKLNFIYFRDINYPIMRQPIMFSHLLPTFCSFGRQNLFHEKASLFQDFVIPALDQETYGEFLHFGPGLGVFILERFSCTDDNSWGASPFQDFVIPALDQETYGEFLQWSPGLGVFTLERFSCTEEDSRQSTKKKSELLECLEQKISPVPTKETGAIPKIKVAAANPKLEIGPKKETGGTPKLKLPRSLACILDKEYLEANDDFCKSSNISSFIRQLNLYGFRKLKKVVRKPLKPFMEIQGKTEASLCSTRKRKRYKFYMQEDDMEDEKPSTPRRRDWYQKNVFPIIDNDNSSSPTKTITRQIDPLYIDLENEESSGPPRHDCYKTNAFSAMAHNDISPPTSRIMMGQIDPESSIDFYKNPSLYFLDFVILYLLCRLSFSVTTNFYQKAIKYNSSQTSVSSEERSEPCEEEHIKSERECCEHLHTSGDTDHYTTEEGTNRQPIGDIFKK